MAREPYLPRDDDGKLIWILNFVGKFATNAAGLGFLAAEVTAANNDAAMYSYILSLVETYTTAKEQRVNFKNILKNGPLGKVLGPVPVAPLVAAPPTAVAAGIFPRIAQLVQRIKNSPNYTEAIGKDLGIIGSEQEHDFDAMRPTLKLVLTTTLVDVRWNKGDADAILIEVDRGSGTWQFLAIDTVPHYQDTTPITALAVWKYRAVYMIDDARAGQWSAVVSITVGG